MMTVLYPRTDLILDALQIPVSLYEMMKSYVTIIFAGIPAVFLYNFLAYYMRSFSNSVMLLVFLGISSVFNIILDVYFIAEMHKGVAGAAAATIIA